MYNIPIKYCATDVLVVGGGYAGLLAALEARERNVDVLILEKAYAGNSGCAKFAAGDIQCFIPDQDDLELWVENMLEIGCNLNDPKWLRQNYPFSYEIIQKLGGLGIPFISDEKGNLTRKTGRGNIKSALLDTSKALNLLRKLCLQSGVQILDRTPIIDIIIHNNTVLGAIALNIREKELVVVDCKSMIVASGGCSFKGPYFGMDMDTGDGVAIALKAGCNLLNMEFSNKYQSTYKHFDVYGMNRFASQGGIFKNKLSERFMTKYDPVLKEATTLDILAKAMAIEIREGRGPIYFDLTGLKKEDREITSNLLGPLMKAIESSDVNFFEEQLEWIPSFTGSIGAATAGLWIDANYETNINNLFAVGDAASKACYLGARVGAGGIGLMFGSVSGVKAGQNAAARNSIDFKFDNVQLKDLVNEKIQGILSPLKRSKGINPDKVLYELQSVIFETDISLIKEEGRLKKALHTIQGIKDKLDELYADNMHDLMKVNETQNMVILAEAFIVTSLERKESRGGHFREDFPKLNDDDWLKRIITRYENNSCIIDFEDIVR